MKETDAMFKATSEQMGLKYCEVNKVGTGRVSLWIGITWSNCWRPEVLRLPHLGTFRSIATLISTVQRHNGNSILRS